MVLEEWLGRADLAGFLLFLFFSEGVGTAGLVAREVLLVLASFLEEEEEGCGSVGSAVATALLLDGSLLEGVIQVVEAGSGSAGIRDGLGRSHWVIFSSRILLLALDLLLSLRPGLAVVSA